MLNRRKFLYSLFVAPLSRARRPAPPPMPSPEAIINQVWKRLQDQLATNKNAGLLGIPYYQVNGNAGYYMNCKSAISRPNLKQALPPPSSLTPTLQNHILEFMF